MNLRTEEIKIRATLKEKERIKRNAKKCGLSVTQYLIKLANGHCPVEVPSDNFYSLCHELQLHIEFFKHQDNERLAGLIEGVIKDLYRIYVYPKAGDSHSNNENLGS